MSKITFEYDKEKNILFTVDDYEIRTEEELEKFFSEVKRELDKVYEIAGGKFYVVSKIDGLMISAKMSELYGERVKEILDEYVLGHARYAENPQARMSVRTASLKGKISPNIYNSKEEAIRAIEEDRAKNL